MRPYWDDVQKAFRALGYIAKRSDYDGMDLHFTNNTSVNRCAKHRAPLMSTLKGIQLGGKCDIGLSFGKIVRGIKLDSEKQGKRHSFTQRFRNKTKWGTSIYVFTSGMWEQECDWLHGIVDPLKELMGRNVMRGEVGVQFIQFGNDALATARLKKLDDQLDGHGVQRLASHRVSTERTLTSTETWLIRHTLMEMCSRCFLGRLILPGITAKHLEYLFHLYLFQIH